MASLTEYRRKRRFEETPEPRGKTGPKGANLFVIQKHAARRLHYDLRLELGGVLKSWAVPKGPSLSPGDKRLAIQVEDHPFEYRTFEGTIPEGHYGAGEVIIWDQGTYEPEGTQSAAAQLERGELKFRLSGQKLRGSFVLVRLKGVQRKNEWLLIKHRDDYADTSWNVEDHTASVVSGRILAGPRAAKPSRTSQVVIRPAEIPGAVQAPMPDQVSVTLATLADKPFSDPQWLFEIKWDGVRTLTFLRRGAVQLVARSGRDVTREYPEFQTVNKNIYADTAVVDGEIVALDQDGQSDFQRMQNRIGVVNPSPKLVESIPLTYYAFDLLYCNGFDLRKCALHQRKELLRHILHGTEPLRYSEHEVEKGTELFDAAKEKRLEGIVGKRIDSPYTGNRTASWVKLKIVKELDAVIAGWTAPRGSRKHFGSLVLGLYDKNELKYIGNVGTGFDDTLLKDLIGQLQPWRVPRSPFRQVPKIREHVEWVRPQPVARVKYANWTEEQHLRAPVFLSLRKDSDPKECTFDATFPKHVPATNATAAPKPKSGNSPPPDDIAKQISEGTSETLNLQIDGMALHFTHLNKVYFPESGIRKRELLAYYYRMAGYILPFLKDRPLVLRRYPNGIVQKSFFQKEAPSSIPEWIAKATVYSDERGGNMDYVMANDRPSLLYLTNLGCIDHNPWSSRAQSQDTPAYVFFDLDPTPGTPFETVLRVARAVHRILKAAQLTCFLKTSGATGFHIFVPLESRYTYEQTRTFADIIGRMVAAELPQETTSERMVRKRPRGHVMIDALQNARGKPLAAVYSARAQEGAPVSTPVTDAELKGDISPQVWTIRTLSSRLDKVGDLWKDFWSKRQSLDRALQLLSRDISRERSQK
jgi:bifunctional non-homologous end joining protein LigD